MASGRQFTDAWGIPAHDEHIGSNGEPSEKLRKNSLYSNMKDCEIVLRFFAFRSPSNVRGSVRSTLDRCMIENRHLPDTEIHTMRELFNESLDLAAEVFGEELFRLPANDAGRRLLSRPLYDALMISFANLRDHRDELLENKKKIKEALDSALSEVELYAVIIGRPNTADAVKRRIRRVRDLISSALEK